MIRDERCKAGKLGKCHKITMGRYPDVNHDAFEVWKLAFGTKNFDDLYAVRKELFDERQQRARSVSRKANEISTSFHCRCSSFEMFKAFEMFKI